MSQMVRIGDISSNTNYVWQTNSTVAYNLGEILRIRLGYALIIVGALLNPLKHVIWSEVNDERKAS